MEVKVEVKVEVKMEVKMEVKNDSIQSCRPANSLALLPARQRFTPFYYSLLLLLHNEHTFVPVTKMTLVTCHF